MKSELMTPNNIKKYLSGVLEAELTLYTYDKTVEKLRTKRGYYPTQIRVSAPKKRQARGIFTDNSCAFGVCAVIFGIIAAIIGFFMNNSGGFFGFIGGAIMAVVYFFIGGAVGFGVGLVIDFIYGAVKSSKDRAAANEEYQHALALNEMVKDDAAVTVKRNAVVLKSIDKEISSLTAARAKTAANLKQFYSIGILPPDYRNIYAVSSIYGYFTDGRTQSLGFNPKTGDQGAFNIYQNERRLDKIIYNTEEIIRRLDEVIHTQRELAQGLSRVNKSISSMNASMDAHLKKITATTQNIASCQAITAYNTAVAARELELMNWMHIWRV